MKGGLCLLLLSIWVSVTHASPFQNLGFDDANTNRLVTNPDPSLFNPHVDTGYAPVTDLLPGWQLYFGNSAYTDLFWLNLNPIGSGLASIYDSNNYYYDPQYHIPVQGRYSFAMFPEPFTPVSFSLVQTGDVPGDAGWLHFTSFGGEVEVFVNGTLIPVTYTFGPQPAKYLDTWMANAEANLSAYAGQTVELKFTGLPTLGTFKSLNGLDAISFSAVPEPRAIILFTIGLLPVGLLCRARGGPRHKPRQK